jgi:hypothetical protein
MQPRKTRRHFFVLRDFVAKDVPSHPDATTLNPTTKHEEQNTEEEISDVAGAPSSPDRLAP